MPDDDDTGQDILQSAELSDDIADASMAAGRDPVPPASPPQSPVPPPALLPQDLSPVEQFAQEVRTKAKWGPAVDVNVRGLMASGIMAGQPVHIQLKHKDPVYLQGVIQPTGLVRCAQYVGGPVNHECSLSEYEKLGNSKERRPGENVHLTNFGLALKDFCVLVNEIGDKARNRCLHCKQGSGLINCKGCSVAAHPLCAGLTSRQQQANWFCAECKASGQDKLPQRPQDLQGRARAPAHRPPPRPQSAAAAASHPLPSQPKANTGRVHMAVPVSGMTPARRERNGNKHKRLFMGGPGGLVDGEPVEYRTAQQGVLLKGEVCIKPGLDAQAGILCECCNQVVSCSKFEAHAGQGSRRAPYDNIFTAEGITLRARAAMLPPLAEGDIGIMSARGPRRVSHSRSRGNAVQHSGQLGGIADGDVIHDLDHDAGGCNICGRPDFALGAFCDRTMILCDQCECEFHVGCLRKADRCDLSQLPTGDWFCSDDCSGIWGALNARVAAGPTALDTPDYTLQLMRGRDTSRTPVAEATNDAIDTAQQVLQESFDPIIDKATKENLLLLMTKAEVKGEYDYRGMYTALLTHQGRAVCAAVFRAFGAQLAEVPLVATKADARRQGHCRVLMTAFEVLLKEAGVRTMCLPAAHETVKTWVLGFGMQPMPEEDLDAACKDLRLLIFPGTQVLHKQLLPPLPPKQGPLMTPPWAEEEPTASLTAGQPAADILTEPQLAADTVMPPIPVLEAQAAASAAATAVAAPSDMLLPEEPQPGEAPALPPGAAAEAADAAPLGGPVTSDQSYPLAAVEGVEDAVMAVPTEAPVHNGAVLQDVQGSHPAAALIETALPSPADGDPCCDDVLQQAPGEAVLHGLGVASQSWWGKASPDRHLQREPCAGVRENGVTDRTEEACVITQDALSKEAAAPDWEMHSPPSTLQQQHPMVPRSPPHHAHQHMVLPTAFSAAEHVQSANAVMGAGPLHMLGSPHATHEEPAGQAVTEHDHTHPQLSRHTKATGLHPASAAEVFQASTVQTQTITAPPMAESFDLNAELPGAITTHPPDVPSHACLNGHIGSWQQPHLSELDGLVTLAQLNHQEPGEAEVGVADTQQPETGSYGWHAEEGGDFKQSQGDLSHTELGVVHSSRDQGPHQTYAAKADGQEPPGDGQSQDTVVSQYIAANVALPSQIALRLVEPLSLGQKRQLSDNDYDAQDSIVTKKQCLALSDSSE
ncbi:hypothetical protein ABBQ32_013467 [Trebouxia sp. C0010 RCD-2024]